MRPSRQTQLERMQHIDFCLLFLGCVARSAIMDRFGISSAAATRDLTQYKQENPKNIFYDSQYKEYFSSEDFQAAYAHHAADALSFLSKETMKVKVAPLCETPLDINHLDLSVVAAISRAISQRKPVKIKYYSTSSGLSQREFVPFAFVDTGVKWNVRGFDRKRKIFMDVVIGRVKEASIIADGNVQPEELPEMDIQWNRIVEMELVPHPNLKHPETIIHEYGIKDGILRVNARASIVGYFLRRLNIDCGKTPDKNPEFQLWLRNNLALYGVENLMLAPRYTPPVSNNDRIQQKIGARSRGRKQF